ncbi:aldose epimerase family protein [Salegentibacter sp. F188]|uniref:Aldose 1-epimerase n=1 Tax=Autumnicola patrickiae TaxID=3075591 RepID=A0ABU3DWV0_9FLAO|nr:aldose epimerase family protein [Salegentibacter sp. F188]MDT0688205.1 aldose epimerase family protein [Salegentibacter sp. F188]
MEHIEKKDLKLITLRNKNQTELEILNFGATLFSLKMDDSSGKRVNVIVSPKRPEDFITAHYKDYEKFFGASTGRFSGRINKGEFKIGKERYSLPQKDGVHLHGGDDGFQYRLWEVEEETSGANPSVTLSYLSKDREEGYPGNLKVLVNYTLSEEDKLSITYTAETDKETIVNLTNHTYLNLNGEGSVSDHFLFINADKILETDGSKLPTGDLINLRKHPKNFGSNKLIGNRPLDDTFVLNSDDEEISARLFSPITGIKMEMRTNQDAIIAFCPEELPSSINYQTSISEEYPSICLKAQNFPDAPNFRNFPSAVLAPGQKYINEISLSFTVKK